MTTSRLHLALIPKSDLLPKLRTSGATLYSMLIEFIPNWDLT
jgi:hypothetical protein